MCEQTLHDLVDFWKRHYRLANRDHWHAPHEDDGKANSGLFRTLTLRTLNRFKALANNVMPVPYAGDLRNASVYVLMQNPKLSNFALDEFVVDGPRRHRLERFVRSAARQERGVRLCYLQDDFRYSGHSYFLEMLAPLFWNLSRSDRTRFNEVISSNFAVVDRVPYHGQLRSGWQRLPSVERVTTFVRCFVRDRIQQGDAIALVIYGRGETSGWFEGDVPDGVLRNNDGRGQSATLSADVAAATLSFLRNKKLLGR